MEENIYFEHEFIYDMDQFNRLKNERNVIIKKIDNLNELKAIKASLQNLELQDRHFFVNPGQNLDFSFNHILAQSDYALSIKAKNLWYYNNVIWSYLLRDFTACHRTIGDHVHFLEKYAYMFSDEDYLQQLSNYLLISAKVKNRESFNTAFQKIESYVPKNENEKVYVKDIIYSRRLELFHVMKDFDKAGELCPEIESFIGKHKSDIDRSEINYLILLLIRAYIESEKYNEAFRCKNLWYQAEGIAYRTNLYKLYTFIICYKLEYYDMLENEIESWKKSVKSKRDLYKLERIITNFFKKVIYIANSNKKIKLIQVTISKLKLLEDDVTENIFFEDFDYIDWMKKIKG